LARIARDLATRVAADCPQFRVGTIGHGGSYSRHLPFSQYGAEGMQRWVPPRLPEVWADFAGAEQGVILTIWDASRLLWFTCPQYCPDPHVKEWLAKKRFLKWGYLPLDATGPNNRLTDILKTTIEGFDRVLAYSAWASRVLLRTGIAIASASLPHGIDTGVFYPRPPVDQRSQFPIKVTDATLLVGIVATNQHRKDWGLGIQTVAEMGKRHADVKLWINTDVLEREWSLPALLGDYGLLDRTVVTLGGLTDAQMAGYYSACDVTLGIGLGEGFGYPLAESLACGTPVVHGNYGGGEYVPNRLAPVAYRVEGIYNGVRPVYSAAEWALQAQQLAGMHAALPPHLDWKNLWPAWKSWLEEGVK
jgi:glycosyltransferase involved in cell wall biosynthesis